MVRDSFRQVWRSEMGEGHSTVGEVGWSEHKQEGGGYSHRGSESNPLE